MSTSSLLRLALRVRPRQILLRTVLPTSLTLPTRTFTSTAPTFAKKDKKEKNDKSSKSKSKSKPEEDDEPQERGKHKQVKSTESFIPASKQPIQDPAAMAEYTKAEKAMNTAVEWFRKECVSSEVRMAGRVTTSILSPVRVTVGEGSGEQYTARLEEVTTVGVKDGTMLLVTPFEEKNMKAIEKGIWDAAIPGIAPQRMDARTIKVPIARPTVEARQELFTAAKRKSEEMRVQVRKQLQASVKKGGWAKRSIELEEFQKLCDRNIAEIDKIIGDLQKVAGGK